MLCLACVLASPTSLLVGRLLERVPSERVQTLGAPLVFDPSSAGILFFELYSLCTASFISGSILLLICHDNPGGVATVRAFPQLECGGTRYMTLLPGAIAATCVWAFHYSLLLAFAIKQVASFSLRPY